MTITNLPPLTWLRAFEAAARHLSFTLAAKELNLTQSAVSQHVRSLEAFLGKELFIRRTRALSLTEAGANFVPTIREAFELLARGTHSFTGGDRGRSLVLQCNLAFSIFWLTPRLKRLYKAHPWLVLNIITPIWDPERDHARAACEIRFGRPSDMPNDARRLCDDRFYPVCHPDYQGGLVNLETARLFDCAGVISTWDTWFKSQNRTFDRANEVNLGSTYTISINAALSGAGIAMAHDTLVADLLAEGALMMPFEHTPALHESYFLLAPPSHGDTPASRAFLDWFEEELNLHKQMR